MGLQLRRGPGRESRIIENFWTTVNSIGCWNIVMDVGFVLGYKRQIRKRNQGGLILCLNEGFKDFSFGKDRLPVTEEDEGGED